MIKLTRQSRQWDTARCMGDYAFDRRHTLSDRSNGGVGDSDKIEIGIVIQVIEAVDGFRSAYHGGKPGGMVNRAAIYLDNRAPCLGEASRKVGGNVARTDYDDFLIHPGTHLPAADMDLFPQQFGRIDRTPLFVDVAEGDDTLHCHVVGNIEYLTHYCF